MAALVILILSDSLEESVGSHVPRVILFGTIPTNILVIPMVPAEVPIVPVDPLVAPEVGAVSIISPIGVLDLVDYSSSSDSDPLADSLPLAPELPLVSPFLCSDYSEANSEYEPAEQRPERNGSLTDHDAIVSRLAWRRISHRSSDRHSSPDSTSDSSSSGLSSGSSSDTSSGPSTKVASPRVVYPSVITPRCSEAFMRWRFAPLSTPYPPTTSESSLDSSSERSLDLSSPSAGPSRKRCISPTTLVPSSTPVPRSIALTLADLLPSRKRFRDSYSPEDSKEEHMEIGTADVEVVADLGIGDEVGAPTKDDTGMGVEVAASNIREDEEEFEVEASAGGTMEIVVDPLVTGGISESTGGDAPDLEGTLYDIAHYMLEVPLGKITEFEIAQRQLEAGQLVASGERASLADRVRRLGRENLRVRALLCIKRYQVDSLRRHMALSQEEFCKIRRDRDDARRRLRRLESLVERRLGLRR
ncbi:hypothetical protein Tco_1262793 [Tanacetum coccineum]